MLEREQTMRPALLERFLAADWRYSDILREVSLALSFNLLLIVSAQVTFSIPFSLVPITGQTFAVLLTAMALGRVRGVTVISLYLAEGALGAPVFAGGVGGLATLFGPTGGYLLGFLGAGWLVGFLAERGWDRHYGKSVLALTFGTATIFLFGLAGLSRFVPSELLLTAGLFPFLPGAALKIALAFGLAPTVASRSQRR